MSGVYPSNGSNELYESILTWLSRSREQRAGRESAETCLRLLEELALAMQDHIDGRRVRVATGWAVRQLATEFITVSEHQKVQRAMTFLEEEQADSGIIVSRGGDLQFWHFTFQEHLAARAIAGRTDAMQRRLLLTDDHLYLNYARKRDYARRWREDGRICGTAFLISL